MEARPPTENRHGGAPKRRARPAGRAPRLSKRGSSRAETRDNEILRLSALHSPLVGVDGKETSKTRAQKRAAGTKKTALFDIVKMRRRAANRATARASRSRRRQRTRSRPRARFWRVIGPGPWHGLRCVRRYCH
jgi:hypothetical protein